MREDYAGSSSGGENFVSKKAISIIYFGGLLLALLILWGLSEFDPDVLVFIHMYPLGCLSFLGPGAYLGYVLYLFIYIYAYKYRQKRAFVTLLIIYIIILCLNVRGCDKMSDDIADSLSARSYGIKVSEVGS